MNDPADVIVATEIIKLAFNEFIKTSVGEATKKLSSKTLVLTGKLRNKITGLFKRKENKEAVVQIEKIIESGSDEPVERLSALLQEELSSEPVIAHEIQLLAKAIIEAISQGNIKKQYNNYGRDQINIGDIHGDFNLGGDRQ